MKRLVKINDRPRENNKKVEFLCSLSLEINSQTGTSKEELTKFKDWVSNRFTQWDKSILEYFLYEYNLQQDPDGKKYKLDFRIQELIKDDTDENLKEQNEKYEEMNEKEDKENEG